MEQTTPTAHVIFDAFASVSGIFFIDQDLDLAELGGTVSWKTLASTQRVVSYHLYLSTHPDGSGRSQIGDGAALGTNDALVLAHTPLGTLTHLVVYAEPTLAEQTTPVAIALVDTVAMVSNVSFPDYDLDGGDLGGVLAWVLPSDTSQVPYVERFAQSNSDLRLTSTQ
jgi:hypothetical protein